MSFQTSYVMFHFAVTASCFCFQAIMHHEGHMDDGLTLSRSQNEESRTARVIRSTVFLFNRFIRYVFKMICSSLFSIQFYSKLPLTQQGTIYPSEKIDQCFSNWILCQFFVLSADAHFSRYWSIFFPLSSKINLLLNLNLNA